jgi:transcriptional regulator with XRE-family HTH domain
LFGVEATSRTSLIGNLFLDLRRALHLSLPEAAGRLGTRIDVIEALEHGHVRRLPPWPETARIVTEYTRVAGIDSRPVLEVIRRELIDEARTLDLAPDAAQSPGRVQPVLRRMTSAARSAAGAVRRASRATATRASPRRTLARLFSALAGLPRPSARTLGLMVTVPLALMVSFGDAGTLRSTASALPEPLAGLARRVDDFILRRMAPVREGLVWIDVADPRSRKADKLQTARR